MRNLAIRAWRLARASAIITVCLAEAAWAQPDATARALFETDEVQVQENAVDACVLAKLASLGIEPAGICTDTVFVRRVYLDVIGTLPTAEEARQFLADDAPDKRTRLIDELLEHDEFADYWSLKWCDALRVKSEFPINLWPNAAQAYHRWIHDSIKENKPYDQFVREMITSSGSNFRVPQVNFYRAVQGTEPETVAAAVALSFMGTRIDRWPRDRRQGLTRFFQGIRRKTTREWKEEIIHVDLLGISESESPSEAILPDGTRVALPPNQDHRRIFADWLVRPDNAWFTGCVVNRLWFWLLGTGIVHEPDDIREDNPPCNPRLLALLQQELVEGDFDLKRVYRLILNSATYQRSCIPTTDRPEAARNFAHYPLRRLDAEVLIDAICQVTGTDEWYASLIPEPWTFIPGSERSIRLADGSITSPFLELFGRPARDSGFASERDNEPTAGQKLHLLNSSHVREKVEQGAPTLSPTRPPAVRLRSAAAQLANADAIRELYLTVLSRYPTPVEYDVMRRYAREAEAKGAKISIDLTWALVNTPEFLYRH